ETYQLTWSLLPYKAKAEKLEFESSEPSVVKMDQNGKLTALSKGTSKVTLTATAKNGTIKKSDSVVVTVKNFDTVEIFPKNIEKLRVGETLKFSIKPDPNYGNGEYIETVWSSSVPSCLTISENGTATAVSEGYSVVSATCDGEAAKNTVGITVVSENAPITELKKLSFGQDSYSLRVGGTLHLTPVCEPADAENLSLVWRSEKPSVATVNGDGYIKGLTAGTTVVTVRSEYWNKEASAKITVLSDDPGPGPTPTPEPENDPVHTVTFTHNGSELKSISVNNGEMIPSDSVPDGSKLSGDGIFKGWYAGDTRWNFYNPVTASLTLSSRFTAKSVSEDTMSGRDTGLAAKQGGTLYLVKGQTYTLPSSETWTSANSSIAKISKKYKLKAVKNGTASIKSAGGVNCSVVVSTPKLSEKKISLVMGESATLQLSLEPGADKYHVSWESSAPETLQVSGGQNVSGNASQTTITALNSGSAKVKAYVGGKAYTCSVKIAKGFSTQTLKENNAEILLTPMQTKKLIYKGSDGFSLKTARWLCPEEEIWIKTNSKGKALLSETSVFRITSSGKITALGPGTRTLQAVNENNEVIKSFKVRVLSPTTRTVHLDVGKKKSVKFYNVNSKKASWSFSDTTGDSVASVDTKGKVTGKASGMRILKCTVKPAVSTPVEPRGFEYTTYVYVEKLSFGEMEGLSGSGKKYALNIKAGNMAMLKPKEVFQNPVYVSSPAETVFVDESGVVYARKEGKAKIKSKVNGVTYTVNVNVTK
ncbi:MAG: Ig-like domain-containing protein, partial [Lachnospiraceae bacterium]|nr:Ig-like domain-containing protein [Lachnospiraceae bacterium]